ncbi:hypothetical protein P691DRAFT_764824 [Macrolepiota fuliginosa MF-IS2]|uniref:WD40 repeat-like protein n=1 Tax=Macrolepiota fuliginosa MF-IS2 TaxID=1400762 RepID=A0A9P6BXA7_9AGAR|nr:hypothetical protein P691DRAFT_764824 [Macrolepiota fuliginosa MF-IS2]
MLAYALEKGFTLNGLVQCITFSPNGKSLAVGFDDNVCIWDTTTWVLELRFRRNTESIRSIVWDSRGRLFFGCSGGLLTMVTFGRKEYNAEGFCASHQAIQFIAINADANLLALGGYSEVTIWRFQDDKSSPLPCRWAFMKQLADPQDKHNRTSVDGIVTWDIDNNIPLFKTGKISHEVAPTAQGSSVDVLVGGGPYYAIPSGKEVRVYGQRNGRDFRCLESPDIIPCGSPIIWAHDETCIIAATHSTIVLLQIKKHRETMLGIEASVKEQVTHLTWNKLPGSCDRGPTY